MVEFRIIYRDGSEEQFFPRRDAFPIGTNFWSQRMRHGDIVLRGAVWVAKRVKRAFKNHEMEVEVLPQENLDRELILLDLLRAWANWFSMEGGTKEREEYEKQREAFEEGHIPDVQRRVAEETVDCVVGNQGDVRTE